MNRIILIGNGFDRAHQMKTSYKSFIDSYWSSVIKNVQEKAGIAEYSNDEIIITNVPKNWEGKVSFSSFKKKIKDNKSELIFKNKFLEIITRKTFLKKWVDIEIEYYELLKELIIKPELSIYSNVLKLNEDFIKVQDLLISYLEDEVKRSKELIKSPFIKTKIGRIIYSPFNLKDFTESVVNHVTDLMYNELESNNSHFGDTIVGADYILTGTHPRNTLKEMLLSEDRSKKIDLYPTKILFLNFNYTSTDNNYSDAEKYVDHYRFKKGSEIEPEFIHIHGELSNKKKNPIIFGFGDELDKNYKTLEQLNNNDFLENIKSIKYLETDNYKKLLEFLNDDYFQIYIFGHSCGISDRTLLNTLFEHTKCGSIKVFYHKKSETEDNFSDVVRNISRSFNNKAEMREKVVNKTFCSPLIE